MRLKTTLLLCLVLLGVIAGCNRSARVPISVLPAPLTEPAPAASQPANVQPTPVPQPTSVQSTLVSLPTVTAKAERSAPSNVTATTPAAEFPAIACTLRRDDYQCYAYQCYDELLEMSFSYPGFITPPYATRLRPGGYAGYSYEYLFENLSSGVATGGRSRDFSEGRGGMITDQFGFGERAPNETCAMWQATICHEVQPGVLFMAIFPQGEQFCPAAMLATHVPTILVALDLPKHPQINGFGFVLQLMTTAQQNALDNDWYSGTQLCDAGNRARFNAWMEEIRQGLQAGTADAEMQRRYDAMLRLAESIQSPYIAAL